MASPTVRTLKLLRDRGYLCAIVERFNTFAGPHGIRIDMFGFADIVAVREREILAVQATGGDGGVHAAHRTKMLAAPGCRAWLEAGGRVLLVSWALRGERGARKLYEAREEAITLGACGPRTEPEPESPRKVAARERREAKRAQTRLRLSPPPPADPA